MSLNSLAPKVELVGTLQVLLPTRRLLIADSLPEVPALVRELVCLDWHLGGIGTLDDRRRGEQWPWVGGEE